MSRRSAQQNTQATFPERINQLLFVLPIFFVNFVEIPCMIFACGVMGNSTASELYCGRKRSYMTTISVTKGRLIKKIILIRGE